MKLVLLITLLLFGAQCLAFDTERLQALFRQVDELLDKKEYEEAARFYAEAEGTHISIGYRLLAEHIRMRRSETSEAQLVGKYLSKGCQEGDYHSCRYYALHLVGQGHYGDAEAILIDNVNKHSDALAASELFSLYLVEDWVGYNRDKAIYWRNRVPELIKKDKKRRLSSQE